MHDPLPYDNPLITRYAGQEQLELWGPQRKHSTWRRLWLALAEGGAGVGFAAEKGGARRGGSRVGTDVRRRRDPADPARTTDGVTRPPRRHRLRPGGRVGKEAS